MSELQDRVDMVERVAKAIGGELGYPNDDQRWNEDGVVRLAFERTARAAIEALREPTDAMKAAALAELSGATDFAPKSAAWDALRAYRAMISSALSPNKGE